MKRFVTALLCLLPTFAPAQSRLSPTAAEALQNGLIVTADSFILPAYKAQAAALATLKLDLTAYCSDAQSLEPVQASFASGFLAWQRASVVQIGPVTEAEGIMRVQLWPDAKGFSRRAVQAAVRNEDPALLDPGALVGRSIALSNLTALEHLIFGNLQAGSYACDLATAIATFQYEMADDFAENWAPGAPYRTQFDTAIDGNGLYPSVDALVRETLAGTVVYADRLRKFKILRGLGATKGEARAVRTEAHKSGLGLASIETSFRALRDFYEVPYGVFDISPDIGGSMEYFILGETAGNIADALSIEDRSLTDIAQEDGTLAQELRGYADLVLYHETYLKTGMAQSIGLTTGFTAADGD